MNYYELPFKKYCFTIYYDLGWTAERPYFKYKKQINQIMQTLIILALAIVVAWILFRPFSKKELEIYNDKNWPDMND